MIDIDELFMLFIASLILPAWLYYLSTRTSTDQLLDNLSLALKKKRKKLRRAFLAMLSRTNSEEEVDRILRLCFLPLNSAEREATTLLKERDRVLSHNVKPILFLIAAFLIIFEALATTAYINYYFPMSTLSFAALFAFFSLMGLGGLIAVSVSTEKRVAKRANRLLILLDLLEESANQGKCVEEIEDVLEES